MPGLINIILFILVFHTHQGGANENQEPNKFFSQINTNMHKTLIKLMQFAILTDIKRLCIFGPKGAIQIHYYYYFYYCCCCYLSRRIIRCQKLT